MLFWRENLFSGGNTPHINLPGDGGGNERGAAFLQEVDGALRFGGEGVEFGGFGFEKFNDGYLLGERRAGNPKSSKNVLVYIRLAAP